MELIATRIVTAQLLRPRRRLAWAGPSVDAQRWTDVPDAHWFNGRARLWPDRITLDGAAIGAESGRVVVDLPLRTVAGVELERGLVAGTLVVTWPDVVCRLRCAGAEQFAEQLRDAVRAA